MNASRNSAEWQVVPADSAFWQNQFKSFQKSAFRLETLQSYKAQCEEDVLREFLQGEPLSRDYTAEWCELVRQHVSAGRPMRRVHIVSIPLSDYMRFEIECAYTMTSRAGEEIMFIDNRNLPEKLRSLATEDFWLFDDSKVMIQEYDTDGAFQRAFISCNEETVRRYCALRELLIEHSVPYQQFYSQIRSTEVRSVW